MERINKTINKIIPVIIATTVITGLFLHVSCKKDETGSPVITNVRPIDPEQADVTLSSSPLAEWIVIQGQNLGSVTHVYFNNYEADFNIALGSDNNIIIEIPEDAPTIATVADSLLTNTIVVVTKHGTATYDFELYPPPPVFERISYEYAKEGETIYLYGQFFYFIDSVIFPGNIPATVSGTAANGSWCAVTVPAGATESGNIRVIAKSGEASYGVATWFNDTTGIFCDFEDDAIQDNVSGVPFIDQTYNPFIPNCRGKYMWFFYTNTINPGTYWIIESAFENNTTLQLEWPDYPESTPTDSLELKFELFVRGTWNSGLYEFGVGPGDWTYRYFFQPWGTNAEDRDEDFSTNGNWITIAIPLRDFWDGRDPYWIEDGKSPLSYTEFKDGQFNMNFKNPTEEEGALAIEGIELAFDNLRIVKIR